MHTYNRKEIKANYEQKSTEELLALAEGLNDLRVGLWPVLAEVLRQRQLLRQAERIEKQIAARQKAGGILPEELAEQVGEKLASGMHLAAVKVHFEQFYGVNIFKVLGLQHSLPFLESYIRYLRAQGLSEQDIEQGFTDEFKLSKRQYETVIKGLDQQDRKVLRLVAIYLALTLVAIAIGLFVHYELLFLALPLLFITLFQTLRYYKLTGRRRKSG